MKITILRGANQIGGSCVAVESNGQKILIDLGLPLDFDAKTPEEQAEIRASACLWAQGAQGVLVSHYHQDHHGLLDQIDPDIPVLLTQGTERMMQLSVDFIGKSSMPRRIELLAPNKSFALGNFLVTAYTVDHSAYDSVAFLIEADGKRLLYSGDMRTHGAKGGLYKLLPKGVDCLLMEGTNLHLNTSYKAKTEREVEQELFDIFNINPLAINYVWCSGQNIDRLVCIYRAALRTNKVFVADLYTMSVLEEMHALNTKIPSVHTHPKMKVLYLRGLIKRLQEKERFEHYAYRLNPKQHKIKLAELAAAPERYVVVVRPSLHRTLSAIAAPQANMITSIWKEYEKRDARFFDWIAAQGYNRAYTHSSGHADREGLVQIVSHIAPRVVVPIHTESGEAYQAAFPNHCVARYQDNEPFEVK